MTPQRPRPSPRLSIDYRPIDTLKSNAGNPRTHSRAQLRRLAQSIHTFGFVTPVVVDAAGTLIAGHGRVEAARSVGLTQVPTITLTHLNEHQVRALMIADNRLAELAGWDEALLAEQLRSLSAVELDFDLEVTGFEMAEIDLRIQGAAPVEAAAPDPEDSLPDDPGPPVARPGDLFGLGRHRVLCADANSADSFSALMDGERAHAAFTDPPYNVRIDGHVSGLGRTRHREFAMASGEMSVAAFTQFLNGVFGLMARHSEPGAVHFACADWRHVREYLDAGAGVYGAPMNLIVWVKHNAGVGSFYRSQHELVFLFRNGRAPHRNNVQLGRFGRRRSNVWQYSGANNFGRATDEGKLSALHPTVKPVQLVADAILDCSARGEIILDPFLGSGTTVMAAERTGRRAFGIEIDPRYVDLIVRRWQSHTGDRAVDLRTGRPFGQRRSVRTGKHAHG